MLLPHRLLGSSLDKINAAIRSHMGHVLRHLQALHQESYDAFQAVHTACHAQQAAANATAAVSTQLSVTWDDSWVQAASAYPHTSTVQQRSSSTGWPVMITYAAVAAAALDACKQDAAAAQAAVAHLLQLLQQLSNSPAEEHQQKQLDKQLLQVVQELAGSAVQLPLPQLLTLLDAAQQLPQTPSQLLSLLTTSAVQQLPQLTPMQLAGVLTALSACHSGSRNSSGRAGPATKQLPKKAALQKAVSRYLQQHQHAFDAESTAAVATALALDSYQQSSSFTLLAILATDHVPDMSPQQLTDVLAACAVVQHYNQAVVDAATQLAVQVLKQQGFRLLQGQASQAGVNEEEPQQQQQQQQFARSSGAQSGEQCQQQQEQERAPGSPKGGLTCDNLARLLWACSSLRHHNLELLDCAAMATLRSLGGMQLQQVVAVVAACAQLNHYNMALFEEACRLGQKVIAEQQQQQQQQQAPATASSSRSGSSSSGCEGSGLGVVLTELAWSCAIMNHLDPPFFQALGAWFTQLHADGLPQEQLLQLYQVQSCLIDAAVQLPELRSVGLPNPLLLASQSAWLQKLSGQQRLTNFHKEVHEALKQAGRRSRLNVALDGPLVVDVALLQHPGFRAKVAIQLETPDMFAANAPHAALGPTAARWRALQARGWQVLSLRYSDWSRLKTPEDQTRYMWHLKEASTMRTPLAPDVVNTPSAGRKKESQSLTKQLWRLLVD